MTLALEQSHETAAEGGGMSEKIAVGQFLQAIRTQDWRPGRHDAFTIQFDSGAEVGLVYWESSYESYAFATRGEETILSDKHLRPLVEFMAEQTKQRQQAKSEGGSTADSCTPPMLKRLAAVEREISLTGDLLVRCVKIEGKIEDVRLAWDEEVNKLDRRLDLHASTLQGSMKRLLSLESQGAGIKSTIKEIEERCWRNREAALAFDHRQITVENHLRIITERLKRLEDRSETEARTT